MLARCSLGFVLGLATGGCNPNLSNTTAPPGDVSAYEPFAHLAGVLAFAGKDARLIEMTAVGVASSGKISMVGDPAARVDHRLAAKDGEGRYVDVRVEVHEPRTVDVSTEADESTKKRHLGMGRLEHPFNRFVPTGLEKEAIALPKCSAAALWKQALGDGAPTDQLATMVYNRSGYELRISKPALVVRAFDFDCKPRTE
ncbi:MAG: hypothetical protein IPI67_39780 [Myxococcales bacterium]|nr:hypothetical protein [Myxococcales bacterium]